MKIKQISTEQFAGIQEKKMVFTDGINVVLGENESGKSTMINAMFHGLTTPAKLDKRREKEFISHCFPSNGADTIDVRILLSKAGEEYTAEKIWDKSGEETLVKVKQSGGALLRGNKAEEKLKELLEHGPAVYSNLVFGRQDHTEEILAWCYAFFQADGDPEKEAVKKSLASVYSAAGGISRERFLMILAEKMEALDGHWDFERNQPEKNRDIDHPWANKRGSILEAYYTFRKAEQERREAEQIAEQVKEWDSKVERLTAEQSALEQSKEKLTAEKGKIADFAKTSALLYSAEQSLARGKQAKERWPALEQIIQTGNALMQTQQLSSLWEEKRKQEERLRQCQEYQAKIKVGRQSLAGRESLAEDRRKVRQLITELERQEGKLSAAQLRTVISLEEGYRAKVQGAEGEVQPLAGEAEIQTKGFVRMEIPGVAEIQVAPCELDVKNLQAEIAAGRAELDRILKCYQVDSGEALIQLDEQCKAIEVELESQQQELKRLLGGESEEEIQTKIDAIQLEGEEPSFERLQEEREAFQKLSGQTLPEAAVASAKTMQESYQEEYGTPEELERLCTQWEERVMRCREQLPEAANAAEWEEKNVLQRLEEVTRSLKENEHQQNEAHQQRGQLAAQEQMDLGELDLEIAQGKERWAREKEKYQAYQRIQEVFTELQSDEDDQLAGFVARFSEKLAFLTNQGLSVETKDGLQLLSGGNTLASQELLSAGTQKTLLLAFRLAVLEGFFPEGEGLVVLDDDLLDMDPKRREQAAALLHRFAERNQVIFTTCDPAIAELLGGHCIHVNKNE